MSFKKKMWLISISYAVLIIVSLISYGIYDFDIEILGSVFFLLTTLYLSLRSYFLEYDKFFKELFKEFNDRYTEVEQVLNNIHDSPSLAPMQTELVNQYFNLCSEEYFWEKRGRIPESVWKNWEEGMIFHLKKKPIKDFFNSEFVKKDSYYGWMTYMRDKI